MVAQILDVQVQAVVQLCRQVSLAGGQRNHLVVSCFLT